MEYVLVSQHNWSEKRIDSRGREYNAITYKPPETLEQARDWPGTVVVEADSPPVRWGHGTYAEDENGKLKLVAADWDSSG